MADARILKIPADGIWSFGNIPIAAATTIRTGHQCSLESNLINDVDAATDDLTFCGIAGGDAPSGITYPIPVHRVCIIQASAASDTYGMGEGVKYSATPTDGHSYTDADANTLGWVLDDSGSARTTIQVLIDIFNLASIAADVKLFQTPLA